jgi:predicted phage baseplate assembly protein
MTDNACGCGPSMSCGCALDAVHRRLPGDPTTYSHRAFLERMLDRVARTEVDGERPLHRWTTRSLDDPGIALLSAQAMAGYVLAWNLRRLHAEATLPEGEDPDALLLLTRLLGHRRRPAMSATTVLSFVLEEIEGSPAVVTVPLGTKVSSIPEPGERPQVFETDADLEARREWNELRPLRGPQPQQVTASTTTLFLTGVGHQVRTGDHVLAWAGQSGTQVTWVLARVTAVNTDGGGPPTTTTEDARPPTTTLSVSGGRSVTAANTVSAPAGPGTVVILGDTAVPFGAAAPDIAFMPQNVRDTLGTRATPQEPQDWADFKVFSKAGNGYLDSVHAAAAAGRVAAFVPASGTVSLARIATAVDTAHSAFGLSARATRITVTGLAGPSKTKLDTEVRDLSIVLETARASLVVPLADPALPLTATGPGQHPGVQPDNKADRLYLEGDHPLPQGRQVVLTGVDASSGAEAVESAVVASTALASGAGVTAATLLRLTAPLVHRFRASTLRVLGNCVGASQGESAPSVPMSPDAVPGAEIVGSGDSAVALQRFPLKRSSLAHVPAPGANGYAPAIEVRVDGRAYALVDRLAGDEPASRDYQVLARPGDGAEIQFGGRLPSGTGNVSATYRTGGGVAGNLGAKRLVQSLTPVPGAPSVTNPVPAEGGSDAEHADEMRRTAPRAIRTLGRAVALADFAAFAEAYRGVGAAAASELQVGRARTVVVTVATASFAPPAAGSALLVDLRNALLAASPPGTKVRVEGFIDRPMSVTVAFAHDPARLRAEIEDHVRTALVARFGPKVRPFARAVHRSGVLAAV